MPFQHLSDEETKVERGEVIGPERQLISGKTGTKRHALHDKACNIGERHWETTLTSSISIALYILKKLFIYLLFYF